VPGILVGQESANDWAQRRGDDGRDRGDGECRLALFRRERVEDDRLLGGLQTAAEEALHSAEGKQLDKIGGDTAKK